MLFMDEEKKGAHACNCQVGLAIKKHVVPDFASFAKALSIQYGRYPDL